jgi:hypothetical protein
MTTRKTTKKAPAGKRGAAAKTAKKEAAVKPAATKDSSENVETILARIQDGFKEAGAALASSGHIMDEKRREILVTLIENAQENANATFAALREVMEAESIGDSLKIQREALRDGIERNLAQVRDVAALAAQSSRQSFEPVSEYFSNLREKVRAGARG